MGSYRAGRISRGFTLVEMLVVIAIIGVLTAMLIPAVQFARERSRQATCSNHLRQIGLAFAQHATTNQVFPNGGAFEPPPANPWNLPQKISTNQFGWGWAYQILPYVEQAQSFDAKPLSVSIPAQLAKLEQSAALVVPGYFCPSRRFPSNFPGFGNSLQPGLRGGLDYAGNGGVNVLPNDLIYPSTDAHDDGITGVVIPSSPQFFSNRPGPGNIDDGQGFTILAGERRSSDRADPSLPDEDNGFVAGWTWDTIRWGYNVPARDVSLATTGDTGFGSTHSGSCIFVFADGAVHQIAYEINLQVFRQMCHRADKKSPDPAAL
jgi:prepilin-type N-terminal cleavage/methylation domain-containing protein